jgi:endoglucanase
VKSIKVPSFLSDLLHARSPSGYETEAQEVFDRYLKPHVDQLERDPLGNRIATLNPKGTPTVMLA